MIIPGDMTCDIQVPHVVFNKPFIYRLCHLYGDWLLPGSCPLLPAGNIQGLSGALLGQWNRTAKADISPGSVVKWFKV
jgi:hypothetical protein